MRRVAVAQKEFGELGLLGTGAGHGLLGTDENGFGLLLAAQGDEVFGGLQANADVGVGLVVAACPDAFNGVAVVDEGEVGLPGNGLQTGELEVDRGIVGTLLPEVADLRHGLIAEAALQQRVAQVEADMALVGRVGEGALIGFDGLRGAVRGQQAVAFG